MYIFDKDGVLFNTEPAKTDSYYLAVLQINNQSTALSGMTREDYIAWHLKNLTGKSRVAAVRGILKRFPLLNVNIHNEYATYEQELCQFGGDVAQELSSKAFKNQQEKILSAMRIYHYLQKPIKDCCSPIKQTWRFIDLLIAQDSRLALITESKWSRTLAELSVCEISPEIFEIIACKDQIVLGANSEKLAEGGKKSQMYGEILRLAKLNANECLAIEDTNKGRREAQVAGITCLQVFFPTTT
ncbi:MAG: HAD hydrolase-like protein [Candidatus Saccharibacteria bacterium]